MLLKKKKDLKFRQNFLKYEKLIKVNKFVFINLISSSRQKFIPLIPFLTLQSIFKKNSRVKIKTRCSVSNRGSSVLQSYGLSRIKIREFLQFGLIAGYKKSVW